MNNYIFWEINFKSYEKGENVEEDNNFLCEIMWWNDK